MPTASRWARLDGNGVVTGAAPFDEEGYRRQTVRVNGPVLWRLGRRRGRRAYLAADGSSSGRAAGSAPAPASPSLPIGNNVVDGVTLPRKLLVHLAPDGRSPADLLDGTIVNEGGETVLAVNGTPIYESEKGGRTGLWAPNGARDVTLIEHFSGLDFSSAESFIDRYAPRAAAYEALPSVLMRMDAEGPAGTGALRQSGLAPLAAPLRRRGRPRAARRQHRRALPASTATPPRSAWTTCSATELRASLGAHRSRPGARPGSPCRRAGRWWRPRVTG